MRELLNILETARYRQDFVFVCGNGGSASAAEHFTNDLLCAGIKAICLNSNVSIITMLANDYGYDNIFSKQLDIYGGFNDVLITISCSGTSPNIVEARKQAEELGMITYAFETFGRTKDYGKLEDKHMQMVHKVFKKLGGKQI